jgi:hypothetical protein
MRRRMRRSAMRRHGERIENDEESVPSVLAGMDTWNGFQPPFS